jgi:tetratricopeptide (TPR) repeat protein
MSRWGRPAWGIALAAMAIGASAGAEDASATARALYQEGARLYNTGQYEQALRAFEQAYALSGAKPLLFNIAQAHRLAGPSHCEQALHAYESYLREDQTASNRAEVEERIVEMRSCVEHLREAERQRTMAERAAVPPPVAAPAPPRRPNGPLILTAAAGGLFLVGAGLYVAARIKYENERANCPCPEGTFATWETVTTTSYVLLATGGAAAAAGVAWWWATPAPRSYAIGVSPSGIYLSGSF